MPVVYLDELPGASPFGGSSGGSPAMAQAMQRAMAQAGIAPDADPFAHTETHQLKTARMVVDRTGRGKDGRMRHQHLDAHVNGVYDDIKNFFHIPGEGKVAQVEGKHQRRTGGLVFSSQPVPEPLVPSSTPAVVSPVVFRSRAAAAPTPGRGLLGDEATTDANDEGCAFPNARNLTQPRTAAELADLLAELKPGKKILQLAVDLDITETFVTEVVIERDVPQPQRKPVLVVMCSNGLPSTRSIQSNPGLMGMWRIGQRSPRKQVLILRCTKKVHVEIHFKLQLGSGA